MVECPLKVIPLNSIIHWYHVRITDVRDSHLDEYDLGPASRDRDMEMLYVLRIGNLEESVRDTTMEETLYHIFKKFGRITVRVAGFGKSRHAFVHFESHDAAQDAHSR